MQLLELSLVVIVYFIALIFILIYRKKLERKPSWWKLVIVFFIGLFSFSITIPMFDTNHQFALIPLGLFVFYICTRKHETRWDTYKPFLWIGFLANYGFFVVGLLLLPLTHALFPPNELSTYIEQMNEAYIIPTHLAADQEVQLAANAQDVLSSARTGKVDAYNWYIDYTETMMSYSEEKFPYLLEGFTLPTGMNKPFQSFVAEDGKGLLIILENEQHYFEFEESLLQLGGESGA